ncbi:tyrosine-type recombinase/integrase [Kribbella sp. NPDC050281]|uniref:tyrosine-type recombinase/integrase n=1 Tax=Kribbella sp. NPDC050281 TaxID=3155515 RepID=UPI0033E70A6B
MSRNANGRSSIYEDANGVWHGWVTVGVKANGKPDRRHRRGATKTIVTKKVEDLERMRDEGRAPALGQKPSVRKWFLFWLENIAPLTASEATIINVYRPKVINRIIPGIGEHRLDRLGPEHLEVFYSALKRSGLSSKTILDYHRMISRSLKMAHRRKLVTVNVATMIDAPSHVDTEIEPLLQEDARAILDQASALRNGARWSVAFALGLRQAEALGMRWRYVDLEKGQLRVFQLKRRGFAHGCGDPVACVQTRHKDTCGPDCVGHARYCPERGGGEWEFRKPKGRKTRPVPIPEPLIPLLRAHKAAQAAERLAAGSAWEDRDLVFCRPDGRPIDARDDWGSWQSLLEAAGVPPARLHDARHTAATLLLEQGVDIRVVQEILGHSSLAMTKRYTHVTSRLARDAADRMGKALWG